MFLNSFKTVKMSTMNFTKFGTSPSFRLFCSHQTCVVIKLAFVTMAEAKEYAAPFYILSGVGKVIYNNHGVIMKIALQRVAQMVRSLAVVVTRTDQHLHLGDSAQTFYGLHYHCASVPECFEETTVCVHCRATRGSIVFIIGIE